MRGRLIPIGQQCEPNPSSLLTLVLASVEGDSRRVGEQEVVGDDVRLRRGVAVGAGDAGESEWGGAAARREVALVVAAEGLDVGLVHRDPVLHPVAKAPEAHVCVCREIIAAFFFCSLLHTVRSVSGYIYLCK